MQCSFPVNLGSFSEVEFIKNLAKDANGKFIFLSFFCSKLTEVIPVFRSCISFLFD